MKTIWLVVFAAISALLSQVMAAPGSVQSCMADGSTINRLKLSDDSQTIYIIYQKGLPHFEMKGRNNNGIMYLDFTSQDKDRLNLSQKIERHGHLLVCFTGKGGIIVDQASTYFASHNMDDLDVAAFEQMISKTAIGDVCPKTQLERSQ